MRVVWQIIKISDEDKEKFEEICRKIQKEHKSIDEIKKH